MALAGQGGKREGAGRPRGALSTVLRLPLPVANIARRLAAGTLRAGDVNEFLDVEARTTIRVPLYASQVPCGFPSPADDYLDRVLDLNELLIEHPAATFLVRVAGESMIRVGMFPGDIAVVDRARLPIHRSIVLALVEGEFTIKRYEKRGEVISLIAENPVFAPMTFTQESGLEIFGVIKHWIRMNED